MGRWFIGSVLSPYEKEENAENDRTFGFSRHEADTLNLENIPVRMEHHPDMEVGRIVKSFSAEDGSKWVVGKLTGDGFQNKFSQHAIDNDPVTGKPYYEGLSLQHAHIQLASDKKQVCRKEAIEVSLVCEPRRSDCRIAFVDSDDMPNSSQIKKTQYILKKASSKMSGEKPVEQTSQPATTVEVAETSNVDSGKANVAGTMTKEAMMKIIIEQQKSLEESKSTQNSELEELRKLKQEIERQRQDERRKQSEKSHAMAKTLVDQWSETLDKDAMSDETKQTILEASKAHPEQMIELLRVAHCASKKHRESEQRFSEYKALMEKTQLSQQFDAVMKKKAVVPQIQQEKPRQVVHAASSKKRKAIGDPELFLRALSEYNSSGSARDHMDVISQIGARKPYSRPTYF